MFKKITISATFAVCLSSIASAETHNFQEGKPPYSMSTVSMPSFSALAKNVGSSVVNITVESKETEEKQEEDATIPGLPFKFKGGGDLSSLGSGFVLSKDGYIATNNHVIDKAGRVIVRFGNDKTEYTASIVGVDPKTDLALLKVDVKQDLQPVYLGDSDSVEVGDWVMAIGNQFQLGQTVTAGIVSAKSRRVPRGGPYDNFIQTDASINPGSSGGPLFNVKGQVVGINTAIFTPGKNQFGGSGFNIGIGFSVPINLAKRVLAQLKDNGSVTRGWLGVIIQPVTPEVSQVLGLESPNGALVSDVVPGSPASKAAFQKGDVIVGYNGLPINENEDLPLQVAETKVGDKVELKFMRAGKLMTATATIEKLDDKILSAREEATSVTKFDDIGLALKNITSDVAAILKLSNSEGALIEGVKSGSLAEKSGFARGDIIEALQFKGMGILSVKNTTQFYETLKNLKQKEPFMVLVRRVDARSASSTTTIYLTVNPS
jgi:serine protease Do